MAGTAPDDQVVGDDQSPFWTLSRRTIWARPELAKKVRHTGRATLRSRRAGSIRAEGFSETETRDVFMKDKATAHRGGPRKRTPDNCKKPFRKRTVNAWTDASPGHVSSP